ncbi:MAG: hypothetical protein ABJB03_11040, partial [Rhodoglobus sp.]
LDHLGRTLDDPDGIGGGQGDARHYQSTDAAEGLAGFEAGATLRTALARIVRGGWYPARRAVIDRPAAFAAEHRPSRKHRVAVRTVH